MMKKLTYYIMALAAILFVSCSDSNKWSVSGSIDGATEGILIVEAADNGYWFPIDTLEIDKSGNFKGSFDAPQYPNIYRLTYNGHSIYLPVDSLESLEVKTTAKTFDTDYELSGSAAALTITALDKKINNFIAANGGAAALDTAVHFKRTLAKVISDDYSSLPAYYIINKSVDGHKLFRPGVKKELAVIGAVANAFNELRPNDPRTRYLAELFVSNRAPGKGQSIEAQESSLIEINLLDENGRDQSLQETADNNKVVILNFTAYETDFSQALNIVLRELYDKYHNAGLQIYQIGFDDSEVQWRLSARNQPWITVFNPGTATHLQNYNVGNVPALFIISNGELTERISDIDRLKSSVARFF